MIKKRISSRTLLPIDEQLESIQQAFAAAPALVISATPGAGKTTRVPVALSQIMEKQIWILEPRRIAAVSAASRIAEENGWVLGEEVGYQIRFENKSSEKTKILFLTEALLLRKLQADPELKNVGAIILDEFHERSVHVDLALGALKELQELSRPDLKIVVMSATLFVQPLCDYLQIPSAIDVPGKVFPLQIKYDVQPISLKTGPEFTDRMFKLLQRARRENPQEDILCFLSGRGEIERLREKIYEMSPSTLVQALHGQISLDEQKSILNYKESEPRIILATNIAESSLTIESVRVVVDSGLARVLQQSPRTGFESLILSRISKASATQRAGRAARLGPGTVYRAWTQVEESSQKDFEVPEIQRVDLAESLLLLAGLGVSQPEAFLWFQKPPTRSLQMAQQMLEALDAITSTGQLTVLGERLQRLPVSPRIGKLLVLGEDQGLRKEICEIAAVLVESHRWSAAGMSSAEDDVQGWLQMYRQQKPMAVVKVEEHFLRLLKGKNQEAKPSADLNELLFTAYKDRLCRRRSPGASEGKMVGGRGVSLRPQSTVKKSEYFLAIEVREGKDSAHSQVEAAVGLSSSFVEKQLASTAQKVKRLIWDEENKKFWIHEGLEWCGLSLGAASRRAAQAEEIQSQMVDLLLERWEIFSQRNESIANLVSRLSFLHRLQEWLMPTPEQIRQGLELACFGETSLENLEKKEMASYLISQLTTEHQRALEKESPEFWRAPTGNRFRVEYSVEQGASVHVRLQEVFGVKETPELAGQPMTFFLLAPNYRPVQVTRDLQSFWKNGYVDVRKEMRARYPKHAWPEDPLTALPQAKGRSTRC